MFFFIFRNLIEEYEKGNTPVPDIHCNTHIKFGKFLQHAQDHFSTNIIATGHYARTSFGDFLQYFNEDKGKLISKKLLYLYYMLNQRNVCCIITIDFIMNMPLKVKIICKIKFNIFLYEMCCRIFMNFANQH